MLFKLATSLLSPLAWLTYLDRTMAAMVEEVVVVMDSQIPTPRKATDMIKEVVIDTIKEAETHTHNHRTPIHSQHHKHKEGMTAVTVVGSKGAAMV